MTDMDPSLQALGDVVDPDTLQQLIDLDDGSLGLIQEMFEIFRDDTPSRIDALDAAIKAGNGEEMGDVAHAIKGAAATMGAPRVRALALILETAGRKGSGNEDPAIVLARLKDEFQQALKAMTAYITARQ